MSGSQVSGGLQAGGLAVATPAGMRLQSCSRCHGFVPPDALTCPHCDALVARPSGTDRTDAFAKRLFKMALNVTGGGLIAMTLMACYGLPPCDEGQMDDGTCVPPPTYCPSETDLDQDGWCTPDDCNDEDPDIFPGAGDPRGDDVDQNCDGADGIRRTR